MAKFLSKTSADTNKRLNRPGDIAPLRTRPGISITLIDYALCEHGVNIVQINTSSDEDSIIYSVSFEFLVTYKDRATRWAKETITTSTPPDSEEFRSALLDYVRAIRKRMQTVTLKCD